MAIPRKLQRRPNPRRTRRPREQRRRAHRISNALGPYPLLGQRRPAQILHHQRDNRETDRRGDLARPLETRPALHHAGDFFEWQVLADGKTKQPYYITLNDQDIFGFAALWDSSKRDDGVTVESCTIVTMPANALMTEIHNVKHRMPAILTKEDRDAWLTTTPNDAFKVLRQYPDTHMVATPVSKRVNTPKNNDAELIATASVA
jgi:putative SOS response-associated peptidase YedK